MANKSSNKRRGPAPTAAAPPLPNKRPAATPTHGQATRETIESLVIAFVLAFLFRTFQAEAFVIPTGSMAPTLMGRHADVRCPECGQRYRLNESERNVEEIRQFARMNHLSTAQALDTVRELAGQCPNCRYTLPLGPIDGIPETRDAKTQRPYSGDRILVNKYLYSFTDPKRWDVVVFKYPGNAVENYIKRLVGLPGDRLRIKGGDIFLWHDESEDYQVLQKPTDKLLAVRQLVHDSARDPATLHKAAYPLPWRTDDAWRLDEQVGEQVVDQSYHAEPSDQAAWLRYVHIPPGDDVWAMAERSGIDLSGEARPQLVTDYNAYNTTVTGAKLLQNRRLEPPAVDRGVHWVGDLLLEVEARIESDSGALTLELVEAGCRFRCTFDVATGEATLTALPFESTDAQPIATCSRSGVKGAGSHSLRLANVDDRLVVWVDGRELAFDSPTSYDAQALQADRGDIIPRHSDADPGDLSPAAVGAQGLSVTVDRLSLWRDIYYIAEKKIRHDSPYLIAPSDFSLAISNSGVSINSAGGRVELQELLSDPATWDTFRERRHVDFALADSDDPANDQFFVMGDNSAASSDARLWSNGNGDKGGIPGGPYLERKMLIGKAVGVYWPHSFDRVPGTSIPFPLFPNFADMRLVR